MSVLFTLYTIPPFLSSALFFILGVFIYLNNRKSSVNRTFALICFVTFWWQFSWFILFNTQNEVLASYLVKIGHIGIIFIPIFCFHFILSFLQQISKFVSKFDKFLLYSSYSIGLLFEVILVTTNYFIDGFYKYFWGFYPKVGIVHTFYILLLTVLVSRIFYLLFANLGRKKEMSSTGYFQTRYILFASIFYVFASSDFFVNYGIEFYPFGFLFISIFLGITAFAIVKHYLFGIRVILTELLVGITAITLLIWTMIAESVILNILGGVLFVFFLIFGWQLVKSVIKEIELRAKLEEAYAELERIDKAKTEFLSIASHQLRTPLSIIKGYISMILEKTYGEIPEKIKQPLGNVYVSNDRLVKLVNDLLDITRLEMGRIELSLEKAHLEEIISSVVEEMKVTAEKKGLYLKYEALKEPLPEISVDKTKIRQVILNLVDNAIKYTQKGGVTVKVRKMNSEVRIEVRDTGVGMSKEEIGNLFEIMRRGRAGFQYWTEGAGVGLYTARKFAEMHGGKVWAESPGKEKGSTFYIELPVK